MTEQNQKTTRRCPLEYCRYLCAELWMRMTSRDYMLALLFLRYLSDNYETAAKKELGNEYLIQTISPV